MYLTKEEVIALYDVTLEKKSIMILIQLNIDSSSFNILLDALTVGCFLDLLSQGEGKWLKNQARLRALVAFQFP